MKPEEILQQIARLWEEPLKLEPAPTFPSREVGLMAVTKQPKFALDDAGRLVGLNLAETGLDDARWHQIAALLGRENVRLQALNVSGNTLTDFAPPPGVEALKMLDIEENPDLANPPKAILEQGSAAILRYFEQLEKEKGEQKTLYEAKLLIIGEAGAGKTTFARRIQKPDAVMPKRGESTHGINVDQWVFPMTEKENFHVNLWDFGGQETYHGTHQFFFSEKSLYVLVADTREQKTDFSYWLNTIEHLAGSDSSLFILLNLRDNQPWKIDEPGWRERFDKMLRQTMTVDLSKPDELPPLQNRICHWMKNLPDVGQRLIESWVLIREDLAKESGNFISFTEFRKICRKHGQTEKEDVKLISGYFHRIGVFTHYMDDPALQDRVWLNSNWLCKTVYRLLEDKTIAALNGRLSKENVEQVWQDNELSFEVDKLTSLLGRFGLMYKVEGKDQFIVPEHLPQVQPYERWPHETELGLLHFRYRFDKYMPKGLMSGLIVALHRHIPDQSLVWNRGVNLAHNGAHAEVREFYGGTNQFDIRIAGGMKRDLLVLITQAFDKMLERFARLKPEKGIRCPCARCSAAPAEEAYFHLTEDIENALIAKAHKPNPTVECKKSYDDIPIRDLLAVIDYEKVLKNVRDKIPGDSNFAQILENMDLRFKGIHDRFDQQDEMLEAQFGRLLAEIGRSEATILSRIDEGKISTEKMQAILDAIEPLLKAPPQSLRPADAEKVRKINATPDLKGKLKLVIPIIPAVLTYETELQWDWQKVKSSLRGLVV